MILVISFNRYVKVGVNRLIVFIRVVWKIILKLNLGCEIRRNFGFGFVRLEKKLCLVSLVFFMYGGVIKFVRYVCFGKQVIWSQFLKRYLVILGFQVVYGIYNELRVKENKDNGQREIMLFLNNYLNRNKKIFRLKRSFLVWLCNYLLGFFFFLNFIV